MVTLSKPSSRRKSRRRSRFVNPASVTVLLLVFSLISVASWRVTEAGWFEARFIHILGRPAMIVHKATLSVVHVFTNIWGRISAAQELEELRHQVDALSLEVETLRHESDEATRLRRLNELPQYSHFHTFPALVTNLNLDRDSSSSLIIGRGSADGIHLYQPVISPNGLLGRIERVLNHSSRVQLLDDPGSIVGVAIENKSWVGIVRGRVGEGVMYLTDLRQRAAMNVSMVAEPEVGDRVLTSGIGTSFPPGLTVGTIVKRIENEADKIFVVEPVYDAYKISEVLIVAGMSRTEEELLLSDEPIPIPPASSESIESATDDDLEDDSNGQTAEIAEIQETQEEKEAASIGPDPADNNALENNEEDLTQVVEPPEATGPVNAIGPDGDDDSLTGVEVAAQDTGNSAKGAEASGATSASTSKAEETNAAP